MSKIGKINISIPEKVKVALAGNIINIEGPLGKKSINVDLDMFNLDIIEGKEIDPSNLNECRYRDVLEVSKNYFFDNEFEGIKLKGSRMWISNKKSCNIDIINFKPIIAFNSCPTYWVKIENSKNRIISIAEGEVIEYEISKPSRKKMMLSKIREFRSFGNSIPDEIHLRKIKKEN